jgi:hypothetical protein
VKTSSFRSLSIPCNLNTHKAEGTAAMGCQVSNCPNYCEEKNSLQFYRCTVIPIFKANEKRRVQNIR